MVVVLPGEDGASLEEKLFEVDFFSVSFAFNSYDNHINRLDMHKRILLLKPFFLYVSIWQYNEVSLAGSKHFSKSEVVDVVWRGPFDSVKQIHSASGDLFPETHSSSKAVQKALFLTSPALKWTQWFSFQVDVLEKWSFSHWSSLFSS